MVVHCGSTSKSLDGTSHRQSAQRYSPRVCALRDLCQLPREEETWSLWVQGLCLVSSDVLVVAAKRRSRGAVPRPHGWV